MVNYLCGKCNKFSNEYFTICPNCGFDSQKEAKKARKFHQQIMRNLVEELGKEGLKEFVEDVFGQDEMFDPDEDCDVMSCRNCGACGSSDHLNWDYMRDEDTGEKITKTENEGTEDEDTLYLNKISCDICGEVWEQYLTERV